MTTFYHLLICSEHTRLQERYEKIVHVPEFQIALGQPSKTLSLPKANSTLEGQVGNCLFLTLDDE